MDKCDADKSHAIQVTEQKFNNEIKQLKSSLLFATKFIDSVRAREEEKRQKVESSFHLELKTLKDSITDLREELDRAEYRTERSVQRERANSATSKLC